jgi:hypothetical protein
MVDAVEALAVVDRDHRDAAGGELLTDPVRFGHVQVTDDDVGPRPMRPARPVHPGRNLPVPANDRHVEHLRIGRHWRFLPFQIPVDAKCPKPYAATREIMTSPT